MHDSVRDFSGVKSLAAIALGAVSLCFSPIPCGADARLPVTFDNPHDGFSISFPSGWAEMPPEKLKDIDRAAEMLGFHQQIPVFHYTYQTTNSQRFLFPAFVCIRAEDSAKYHDTNAILAELANKDALPAAVQAETPTFDQELNAFILKGHARLERPAGWRIRSGLLPYARRRNQDVLRIAIEKRK